jgi:chromosome segregation ATPase
MISTLIFRSLTMFDKQVKKLKRNLRTIENEIDEINHKLESFDSDLESDLDRLKADFESEIENIQRDYNRTVSDMEDDLMSAHMSMEELNEEVEALQHPFRYYYQVYLNKFNNKLDRFNQRVDKLLHFGGKA